MERKSTQTKILLLDDSEASFQIWQCIARALDGLPPLEMIHAIDATEALQKIEQAKPDVVVVNLDDELVEEKQVFMDSLFGHHPPIVVPNDPQNSRSSDKVIYVNSGESLDGIHKTLLAATAAATRGSATPTASSDRILH